MKINKLILYTSELKRQIGFYQNTLGVPLLYSTETSAIFAIGATNLVFEYRADAKPYHFAINIPSNKEKEALDWLKQRLQVLPFQGNELVDFVNWNAKSIYFYDADKNIVELIARKNLKIEEAASFDQKQLLCVSEIGLAVNNVRQAHDEIISIRDIGFYFGNLDNFCAIGDELGLFIIIDKNQKNWMPNNDPAYASDFVLYGDINIAFLNGELIELHETH